MKKTLEPPKRLPRHEADRRIESCLQSIQRELMPEHAADVAAINLETGEYTLGRDDLAAALAFRKKWPGVLAYLVRVNGGPVVKFHR
jgi:hypothetical protein